MALEIALINGHPVVIDTPTTGVPYYTNDNITFANADKIARMNFAGSLKSTNPGASDWNYLPGAVWANTGTDQLYFCVDNTSGAAQWKALGTISSVGSGLTGDGNTTPLRALISPNANNALSLLANGLFASSSSGTTINRIEYYPEDYGAVPGVLLANATGLTAAQNNADALSNCIAAAYNYGNSYVNITIDPTLGGADGNKTVNFAGSIGTRQMPVVVINKHFQLAKPVSIPQQGGYLLIDGYGGALSRWGYETGIYSWDYQNPSGTFAIEIGMPYTEVSTTFHANVEGLRMYGFPRAFRLGIAPNNVNLGRMFFKSCYFAGPDLSPTLPKTIGMRVFNRSADITFENCTWDCFGTSLDIQSIDRIKLRDCRFQAGQNLFDYSYLQRKPNQAQIVLQHGRLVVDNCIGNPPLADASTTARNWSANSSVVKNEYIDFSGSNIWGSGSIWRTINALTTSGTMSAETGNIVNFSSKWENVKDAGEISKFANIDIQRYFWFWVKDFDSWQPHTEYIPGDCILQNYSGTADPVYWSRINYTTGSGPTWAADRHNWHVIDSMKNFTANESLVAGDIRLNGLQGSLTGVFYRIKSNAAPAIAPTGNDATWEIMTGILITDTTNYSWLVSSAWPRAQAAQPISAWNDLTIANNTILGAENGGLTPIFWSHPARTPMANKPLGLAGNGSNLKTYKWEISRKMASNLTIKDSTLQTDRRIPDITQTGVSLYAADGTRYWPAPIVVLSGLPSNINIKNNYWNDTHCVAILYDPTASVLPKVRTSNNQSHWGFTVVNVGENYGCKLTYGLNEWPTNRFFHVNANYVPDDLKLPLITQSITGGANALSLLPAFTGNQIVSVGHLITGIDPLTSYQQIFRSKFYRTTTTGFNAFERKYWDICETGTANGTIDIAVDTEWVNVHLCPGKYEYRSNNPVSVNYNGFTFLEDGKIYTIFHENNKVKYQNQAAGGFIMATGSNNVTPPASGIMCFMSINNRIIEFNRNF